MTIKKTKQILFLCYLVLPFVGGLFDFAFRDMPDAYGVYSFTLMFGSVGIMFAWYVQDTNHIGYQRSIWLNTMVVAITVIALPYYFFNSRGFKTGVIYLLLFILMLVLYFAAAIIGTYVGDNYLYQQAR